MNYSKSLRKHIQLDRGYQEKRQLAIRCASLTLSVKIFLRNQSHILGAGKYEICRAGQQARKSGKSCYCSLEAEFLLWEASAFAFTPSAD